MFLQSPPQRKSGENPASILLYGNGFGRSEEIIFGHLPMIDFGKLQFLRDSKKSNALRSDYECSHHLIIVKYFILALFK